MHQDVNSNSRGSLLKQMEVESDSDVPEYSLPPKSIVKRPKKAIKKRTRSNWKKYIRKCCRYCSGVLLALVLCACVLSIALLFWFSLRLYRDVENLSRRLTIEINRVQTEQVSNVEKCLSLKTKMTQNMKVLQSSQENIKDFKRQLQLSYVKIALLNGSLLEITHMLHSPISKMSLSKTVNALKKGMADTGAEMTRISDKIKRIEEQSSSQSKTIRNIVSALYNMSSELTNITGKSLFHNAKDYLEHKFQDEKHSNKVNSNGSLLKKIDVYNAIRSLNNSLSAQVKQLQTVTQDLKNTQVANLTLSNINTEHIFENSHQIRLLWQELELQNESIVQIQHLVDQNTEEYKSGAPSRHGAAASTDDSFEVLSEGTGSETVPDNEQRRDTLRFENAHSQTKYTDRFGELIEDNIT